MTMRYLALAASLLMMSPLSAQEEETGPWSGKATLGYLATDGNTENTSLNTGFALGYESGKWIHGFEATAVNATQQGDSTAESYVAGLKTEYNFNEFDYAFGRISWRKDRFSGYDQQLSETVGYGRRLINTEAHILNAEIGAGARQLDVADGTSESEFIVRGGLDYTWQFSENAQFTQDFVVESGDTNTFLESISAIKATLIGDLALVASYTLRNNSDVPAGLEKTDTFTALSLEYGF